MIKPQDKLIGFSYQILGFSIIYLGYSLIKHVYDTWYVIPAMCILFIGLFIIGYGISKFIIDYESLKQKKKIRNNDEGQLES